MLTNKIQADHELLIERINSANSSPASLSYKAEAVTPTITATTVGGDVYTPVPTPRPARSMAHNDGPDPAAAISTASSSKVSPTSTSSSSSSSSSSNNHSGDVKNEQPVSTQPPTTNTNNKLNRSHKHNTVSAIPKKPTMANTPVEQLISAILEGDIHGIQHCIHTHGPDLTSTYWTDVCRSLLPLHRAITGLHFHGSDDKLIQTLDTLVQLGADVHLKDRTGTNR